MKQNFYKATIKNLFILLWAAICVFTAIYYPSRFNLLQGYAFYYLEGFPARLKLIPFFHFIESLSTSILGMIIFSLIYVILGASIIYLIKLRNKEKNIYTYLTSMGTSFLIGHWLLASWFMILAISDKLTVTSVSWSLVSATLVGIFPASKLFLLPIIKRQIATPKFINGKKYRTILYLSLSILILSLMYSSSRLGYDSVYIYFSDPKLTAISHGLRYFQNDMFVISSFQTGIQYSALMLIFNDQTARLFSWVSGLTFIVFCLALAEKAGLTNRAKAIVLALLLTSTAFIDLLGDAKVDLASSAIIMAAIYWIFSDDNKLNKLVAGFFLGFSIASRPYNLFLIGVFTVSLYSTRLYLNKNDPKKRGIGPFIKSMLWIGIGAIPPLAFHLIANLVVFNDMFAMLANTQNIASQNWQWSFNPEDIWIMRMLYPFVVTFLNTSQSIGNISPLFLAFLPNIFFVTVRKKYELSRPLIEMLTAALITLTLWIFLFFTIMEIRYIFFLWVILFIAIANIVVIVLDEVTSTFSSGIFALVIFLLGFTIFRVVYISFDTYSPVDKLGNPQCNYHVFCEYLNPINKQAAEGDRVLSLLAYRYYLRTDLFACSTRLDEYDRIRKASKKGSEEFWMEVYRQGYKYIAYENNYSVRHLYIDFIPEPKTTPDWIDLEPLFGGLEEGTVAYRIIAYDPPVSREKVCLKTNGVWKVEKFP